MRTPSVQLLWGLFLSTITALALACPICLHATVDPPVSATVQVGLTPSFSSLGGLQFNLLNDPGALFVSATAINEAAAALFESSHDQTTTRAGWVSSAGITTGANPLFRVNYSITNGTYPRFAIDPSSINLYDNSNETKEIPATAANFVVSTAYRTQSGAVHYLLNSINAGTGTGTVTSNPSGLACIGACSAPFNAGVQVTLMPTASADSYFVGWSGGGCSGTGNCAITMNGEKTVSATFNSLPPVKLGGSYYSLIRDAYASAASGNIIRIKAIALVENVVFDKPVSVTLTGGADGSFASIIGYTTVIGSMTIEDGMVVAENVIIM